MSCGKMDPKNTKFCSRNTFIANVERDFKTKGLKPKHVNVSLSDGSTATVSVFDIEHMLISILSDNSLMRDENISEGYDVFTGKIDKDNLINKKYAKYTQAVLGSQHVYFIAERGDDKCLWLRLFWQ